MNILNATGYINTPTVEGIISAQKAAGLPAAGYLGPGQVTGYIGTATVNAIRAAQSAAGLTVSGTLQPSGFITAGLMLEEEEETKQQAPSSKEDIIETIRGFLQEWAENIAKKSAGAPPLSSPRRGLSARTHFDYLDGLISLRNLPVPTQDYRNQSYMRLNRGGGPFWGNPKLDDRGYPTYDGMFNLLE